MDNKIQLQQLESQIKIQSKQNHIYIDQVKTNFNQTNQWLSKQKDKQIKLQRHFSLQNLNLYSVTGKNDFLKQKFKVKKMPHQLNDIPQQPLKTSQSARTLIKNTVQQIPQIQKEQYIPKLQHSNLLQAKLNIMNKVENQKYQIKSYLKQLHKNQKDTKNSINQYIYTGQKQFQQIYEYKPQEIWQIPQKQIELTNLNKKVSKQKLRDHFKSKNNLQINSGNLKNDNQEKKNYIKNYHNKIRLSIDAFNNVMVSNQDDSTLNYYVQDL